MKGKNVVSSTQAVAAAAHELKAPLVLMRHLVQSLNNDFLNPAERRQHIERLAFTTDRMLRLTQDLTLSYRVSEGTEGEGFFQLEPLNMGVVCEQAIHEMTPYARAHGQTLQLASKRRNQLVLAHRDVLHDIVVNLVDNAIQHSGEGDSILIGSQGRGELIRLSVHDNGYGVTRPELKRLQETIGVRPQPLSGRAGTSGLGLFIASQLAQAMGGGLGVGRAITGMTFFVDLIRSRQISLL